MDSGIDPDTRLTLVHALAVAALLGGALVAGCGGSSAHPSATSTTSTGTGSAPPSVVSPGVAFARCMRASGVPSFPDPLPGRELLFNSDGVDQSAPAFRAAQAKCSHLLAAGGPPGPGSTTHPSARTLEKLVRIATCMREHGVPDFPDPRTSVPVNPFPSGAGIITDYDGAILLFPGTLDMSSPAYNQAAAKCGTLAKKLGRGPHS